MKYNHKNRISLPCYEYAFRTWPLYEWSVKVSTTYSAVEISRKPYPPFPRHTYTEIIQSGSITSVGEEGANLFAVV